MLISSFWLHQAMHANTAVAAGMKGANKAMGAMNKVIEYGIHEVPPLENCKVPFPFFRIRKNW